MEKSCGNCLQNFTISRRQFDLLDRVAPVLGGERYPIAAPSLCPDCRLQRRLAHRNQLYVYQRRSALSGKPIFSSFSPDAPVPVLSREEWWGDGWDALDLGRAFEFGRPFFAQFCELRADVPHISTPVAGRVENSDYCNNIAESSNCYLVFATAFAEDCLYCESVFHSKSCMDCTQSHYCELCYDCTACSNCYNLQSSAYSERCSESFFLFHCKDCEHCYGCANLRHKRYCIFNRDVSEEEYLRFISGLDLSSFRHRAEEQAKAALFWQKQPIPHAMLRSVEESNGNFLANCRRVTSSFFIQDGEDLENCYLSYDRCVDCLDCSFLSKGIEVAYEFMQAFAGGMHLAFSHYCVEGCTSLYYCSMCVGCADCFGCIGLRRKRHCIFNRPYSKAEYETLVPRIIEHMRCTGEWGEFFPIGASPIPYNHSFAQRYFPLSRHEAEAQGAGWYDKPQIEVSGAIRAAELPDGLPEKDLPMTVLSAEFETPFRITAEEVKRCRAFNAPLPRTTYDERMRERSRLLGSLRLFPRSCAKTGRALLTPWDPQLPWIVWDSEEYQRTFS